MVRLPDLFEETIRAAARLRGLRHVDPAAVLVMVHPLKADRLAMTEGFRHARVGPSSWPVFPVVTYRGVEKLYAVSFQPWLLCRDVERNDDPLSTVLHELWHIAPACDGTLRRAKHGPRFNQTVESLRRTFIDRFGDPFVAHLHARDAADDILLRRWENRRGPRVLRLRRHWAWEALTSVMEIEPMWGKEWSDRDIVEECRPIAKLVPRHRPTYVYVCPNGHRHTAHVRFRSPRSCATCSPRFDQRHLLKYSTRL